MGSNDEIGLTLEDTEDITEIRISRDCSDNSGITDEPSPDRRQCWVCFANDEEDDDDGEWVRPCRCRGTAKWVHQECLQRWIDEKQKINSTAKVMCAQCNTEYLLIFPPSGRFIYLIEWCDRLLYAISPFAAATCVVGSIYWSAVSYGAVTVMQILGQDEGKAAMEAADPLMLLVGLPSIPVMLILGKLIRWDEQILKLWRQNHHKIPFLDYIIGTPLEKARDSTERVLIGRDNFSDPISATRMFCGALLLPTVATIVGRCLFDRVQSNWHRALLGGFTFILTKGAFKIYLRQQQFIKHSRRKVLNFNDDKNVQSTQTIENVEEL